MHPKIPYKQPSFSLIFRHICVCSVPQACLTLCDAMEWGLSGTPLHGISQARILEWVVNSFSRGSSWPKDWTHVSCIGRQILYCWAIEEAPFQTYFILLCFGDIAFFTNCLRGIFLTQGWTCVSCIPCTGRWGFFTTSATWEALGRHYAKWNQSDRERQILYAVTHVWSLNTTTN